MGRWCAARGATVAIDVLNSCWNLRSCCDASIFSWRRHLARRFWNQTCVINQPINSWDAMGCSGMLGDARGGSGRLGEALGCSEWLEHTQQLPINWLGSIGRLHMQMSLPMSMQMSLSAGFSPPTPTHPVPTLIEAPAVLHVFISLYFCC